MSIPELSMKVESVSQTIQAMTLLEVRELIIDLERNGIVLYFQLGYHEAPQPQQPADAS